jgi:hypothetical protein
MAGHPQGVERLGLARPWKLETLSKFNPILDAFPIPDKSENISQIYLGYILGYI